MITRLPSRLFNPVSSPFKRPVMIIVPSTASLRVRIIADSLSASSATPPPPPPSSSLSASYTTMASASISSPSVAAPWRSKFLEDVGKMKQPSFTFTSLHTSGDGTTLPRGRTCIYRGLWASLPENDKNSAPRNPIVYESDCLVLTTDARMDKVPEIFSSSSSSAAEAQQQQISHSGGGGPVEAMFWAAETGTQWRIRGHAWVLSLGDIASETSPGAKAAREALLARMRKTSLSGAGSEETWEWEKEIVGHFGNLSPGMRGSFKNPSPGTPRANRPGPGEGLGQKVGDELLDDEIARKNFRVVVVVPDEVDLVDLHDPADQRRWLYTFVGSGATAKMPGGQVLGEWEKTELWP